MKRYYLILFLSLFLSCSDDDSQTPDEDGEEQNNTADFVDEFNGTGSLVDYVTNNALALPQVTRSAGRYYAELTDNTNNTTLHFNEEQGRLDAKALTFPFQFIARNIGIGTMDDSQSAPLPTGSPYIFSGVQVHVTDFNSINSSHVVVGHRGGTGFTIEGKNTVNGDSSVNDIGANTVPEGRADIRIVGDENNGLTVYWQLPNLNFTTVADNWILYNDTGQLPGEAPSYGNEVYVGLITYAFGDTGVPFIGTCDAIQITD
ncbi:hypothetical protein [Spongiimicrobium sp. 3-5]|uniref:hypothetical protein n=1 Tax=Spongiimicrobium sp. 3-5 TaxID=3332596 RepID=UPI00397F3B0D